MDSKKIRSVKILFYKYFYIVSNFLYFPATFLKRKKTINNYDVLSIGILMQWGLGDLIIYKNLILSLRMKWPNSIIYLIGNSNHTILFKNEIDNLKLFNLIPPWSKKKSKYTSIKEYIAFLQNFLFIRKKNFNILITPRFDFRDNLQLLFLRANQKFAYEKAGFSKHFRSISNIDYKSVLATNSYFLCDSLSKKITGRYYIFNFKKRNNLINNISNNLTDNNYLIFHGGSSENSKNFCLSCNKDILLKLIGNYHVILIKHNSYDYKSIYDYLIKNKISVEIISLNLIKFKDIFFKSKVFIGVDSGFLHYAAACELTTIGFYLNRNQQTKWSPISKNHYSLFMHKKNCHKINYDNKYSYNYRYADNKVLRSYIHKKLLNDNK